MYCYHYEYIHALLRRTISAIASPFNPLSELLIQRPINHTRSTTVMIIMRVRVFLKKR